MVILLRLTPDELRALSDYCADGGVVGERAESDLRSALRRLRGELAVVER